MYGGLAVSIKAPKVCENSLYLWQTGGNVRAAAGTETVCRCPRCWTLTARRRFLRIIQRDVEKGHDCSFFCFLAFKQGDEGKNCLFLLFFLSASTLSSLRPHRFLKFIFSSSSCKQFTGIFGFMNIDQITVWKLLSSANSRPTPAFFFQQNHRA